MKISIKLHQPQKIEICENRFIENNEKENICCVGDDDQSIYSWRGAEIKNFLDFDKIYENTKIKRFS